MGFAGLLKIDDPRDSLQKARRWELLEFARANGVTEIKHDMPADIIRRILRSHRLTNIRIPRRVLGQNDRRPDAMAAASDAGGGVTLDAGDDLMRQYQAGAMAVPAAPSLDTMTRAELAKACKAKGIAMARTDKKETLMEKLSAHG